MDSPSLPEVRKLGHFLRERKKSKLIHSLVSTLAASTRDESTSSPEQNQLRTESQRPPNLGVAPPTSSSLLRGFSPMTERVEALDLDALDPLKREAKAVTPTSEVAVRHKERGPPLSADLLSTDRNRRSKSEERLVSGKINFTLAAATQLPYTYCFGGNLQNCENWLKIPTLW